MRPIALLALTVTAGACSSATPPAPSSAPAAGREVMEEPRVCAIRNGALEIIPVRIDAATGDTTTVDGLRISDVSPASEYAAGADWYQRNEVIVFRGLHHVKYGLPLQRVPTELARVGDYRGVAVFADSGYTVPVEFIYIPDRPGCMFQRYEPPHRQE